MEFPIATTAKRTARFTPPSLRPIEEEGKPPRGGEKECTFVLRIPTPSERDKLGTRLYELGVIAVSQETVRATLIDELFRVDWAAEDKLGSLEEGDNRKRWNETFAEEIAEFMDGYWSRIALEEQAQAAWNEQEVQRQIDNAQLASDKQTPPLEPLVKTVTVREGARAKLIVDDMMERSARLRKLAAKQLDYSRQNGLMMVRIHLLDFEPVPAALGKWPIQKLMRDKDGLVPVEQIDQLREYIGDPAYHELVGAIDGHYTLGEAEEKNFDSPLGKPSDQIGSETPSGDLATSDGSSTGSSTGPIPSDESGSITGKSSASTAAPAARKSRAGQTGKR